MAEHNLDALGREIHRLLQTGNLDPKQGVNLLHYFERGASALHTYLRLGEAGYSLKWLPWSSPAFVDGGTLGVSALGGHLP